MPQQLRRSSRGYETASIVEAPCPRDPDLQPRYDPEVAQWLKLFGGDDHEKLQDWLATAPDLEQPTSALVAVGPPLVGKTLLAFALARLYKSDRPADLASVMADFNDGMLASPIVLADEELPKDYRGQAQTARLRQLIQARRHKLNRKFLSEATVRGALRG